MITDESAVETERPSVEMNTAGLQRLVHALQQVCQTISTNLAVVETRGSSVIPDGSEILTDGSSVIPDGSEILTDGSSVIPDESEILTDRSSVIPDGSSVIPDGSSVIPDKSSVIPDGSSVIPDGSSVIPDGSSVLIKNPRHEWRGTYRMWGNKSPAPPVYAPRGGVLNPTVRALSRFM